MQVSVDGFVAGPSGELDWQQRNWDPALLKYVEEIAKDCIAFDSNADVQEIKQLKREPGNDILVHGNAELVSLLLKENLIDEYHFFINPTAIGSGIAIFSSLTSKKNLKLITSRPFDCGVVLLFYKPD